MPGRSAVPAEQPPAPQKSCCPLPYRLLHMCSHSVPRRGSDALPQELVWLPTQQKTSNRKKWGTSERRGRFLSRSGSRGGGDGTLTPQPGQAAGLSCVGGLTPSEQVLYGLWVGISSCQLSVACNSIVTFSWFNVFHSSRLLLHPSQPLGTGFFRSSAGSPHLSINTAFGSTFHYL